MIDRLLSCIAGLLAASTTPGDTRPIANAWMLFGLIASLLFVFFLVVILLVIQRRHRRARRSMKARKTPATVDPWAEAGQRAQPFPTARDKPD
jgi:hypothetical protein